MRILFLLGLLSGFSSTLLADTYNHIDARCTITGTKEDVHHTRSRMPHSILAEAKMTYVAGTDTIVESSFSNWFADPSSPVSLDQGVLGKLNGVEFIPEIKDARRHPEQGSPILVAAFVLKYTGFQPADLIQIISHLDGNELNTSNYTFSDLIAEYTHDEVPPHNLGSTGPWDFYLLVGEQGFQTTVNTSVRYPVNVNDGAAYELTIACQMHDE